MNNTDMAACHKGTITIIFLKYIELNINTAKITVAITHLFKIVINFLSFSVLNTVFVINNTIAYDMNIIITADITSPTVKIKLNSDDDEIRLSMKFLTKAISPKIEETRDLRNEANP